MAVDTCPLAGITWLVPLPLQGTAANRRLFSAGLDFPTPGDRRNCSSHRVQDCDVPDITVGGGRNAKASTSHAKGKDRTLRSEICIERGNEHPSGTSQLRRSLQNCVRFWKFSLSKSVILFFVVAVCGARVALFFCLLGWRWEDLFPRDSRPNFDAEECGKFNVGAQVPCGGPWASPCFSRDRCVGPDGLQRMSVYVHDYTCSGMSSSEIVVPPYVPTVAIPIHWVTAEDVARRVAHERSILAQTPEEACIIVYAVPMKKECASSTQNWQNGMNHLLLDFNDQPRSKRRDLRGNAMFAESNMRPCYFRYGHDIAVPLPPMNTFGNLRDLAPRERKYFATFKGTYYPRGDGKIERGGLYQLAIDANSTDVVVAEHCLEVHQEHLLPENVDRCKRLNREYLAVDYADIMNTTFALVPAGRSPATYRLGEALSAGAIPVFVHDNFVKPFPARIPWHRCSFTFSSQDTPGIIDALRAVPHQRLLEMQVTARRVFDQFFSGGMEDVVRTMFDILEERMSFSQRRRLFNDKV